MIFLHTKLYNIKGGLMKILIFILITSFLIFILITSFCAQSENALDFFVKGHSFELRGQDSLACCYYEKALEKDSSSIPLREILALSQIQNNHKEKGTYNLRTVAKYYLKEKNWTEAFSAFKNLYSATKNPMDGANLATALYYYGISELDSNSVSTSIKIFEALIEKASPDTANQIKVIKDSIQKDSFKPINVNQYFESHDELLDS